MAINDLLTGDTAGLAFLGAFFIGMLVLIFIAYVISALALMKIAQRTKTENAWLAWIPIANIFLMVNIAQKEWWYALIILFIGFIPFLGAFASLGLVVYIWWLITERLGKSGALSLLMIIPIINLGFMLYLAFSD
ncbi:MAG: hypothetical protein PF569_09805 [Candidatus Woesearchaeota archaeon]|jgi:hypothetical protein|nr:hypothetical protein [Candidatus Woesearchaeota archaeon]